jgi:hypothetical protein
MNRTTAHNHKERLAAVLDSIYSAAKIYNPTHLELLAQKDQKIWSDPGLKRCPMWVWNVLSERDTVLFHDIQRNWTIWLFPCPDGIARSWEALDEATRASYCAPDRSGVIYWLRAVSGQGKWTGAQTGATVARQYIVTERKF